MNHGLAVFNWVKAVPYGDKVGHFTLYGGLAYLANSAFGFRFLWSRSIQIGSVLVLSFAIGEEITQIWLKNRTFDYFDLLFDLIGIVVFTVLSLLLKAKSE